MNIADNRNKKRPIPKNFSAYLTLDQEIALMHLGKLGWRLKFIRRPFFQLPTVVLRSRQSGNIVSVLERDGRINTASHMKLRAQQ
jgi:hypothetical protein